MAAYNGVMAGDQSASQIQDAGWESGFVAADKGLVAAGAARIPGAGGGSHSGGTPAISPAALDGLLPHSFGDDQLFWRVWFAPEEIDAGFIVEEREWAVKVWNAHLDKTVEITSIVGTAMDGTELAPTDTPIDVGIFGERVYTLTVLRDGPPLQDTVYRFTIDSIVYDCHIIGTRVIAVFPEPNWRGPVRIGYTFETVVAQNKYFREQRRALRTNPLRQLKAEYLLDGIAAEKFGNDLTYGHDKVFGVPVYSEHIYTSDTLTGQNSFDASNDISKHWNLQNLCDYIMIVDHGAGLAEVKEVASVVGSTITLERDIVLTFTPHRVIIYPVFFALLETLQSRGVTDGLENIMPTFTEYDDGG